MTRCDSSHWQDAHTTNSPPHARPSWFALLALVAILASAQPAMAQRFVGTIDMPVGADDGGNGTLTINPQTGHLYVVDWNSANRVIVADRASNSVLYELPAYNPTDTAFDPVRNRIYLSDASGIQVFDAADDTYLYSLYGTANARLEVDPDAGLIYAFAGPVYILDADAEPFTDAVIGVVDPPLWFLGSFAVNVLTNTFYFTDSLVVVAVDGDTGEMLAVVPIGWNPYSLIFAVDPEGNRVYLSGTQEVIVLDGTTHQTLARIRTTGFAMGMAVDPLTHRVYVTCDKKAHDYDKAPYRLNVIDGTRQKFVAAYPMSPYAQSAAVDPLTGLLYVAERYGDVHVFQDVAKP